MKVAVSFCGFVVGLFVIASVILAQENEKQVNSLEKGKHSIAFSLPSGGGSSFGFWSLLSERTSVGMNLNFSIRKTDSRGDKQTSWGIQFIPALKRYMSTKSSVSPYIYGDIRTGYRKIKYSYIRSSTDYLSSIRYFSAGASLGVGVDWFPVSKISIGGYTGISGSFEWGQSKSRESGKEIKLGRNIFSANTFTSELTIHIYF